MRQTRQPSLLHIAALALLFPYISVVSAIGNYKYCCDIQKCKNVTSICLDNPSCKSVCAAHLSCESLDQLAVKDYSCFHDQLKDNKYTALDIICHQKYNALQPPAPTFYIDYATCNSDCGGWRLAPPNEPDTWAAPILQYILPVVIFSMTIPRRQKWEVSDWWFNIELKTIKGILFAVISLFWAGLVVVTDMTVWVFEIFLFAGPMLVGGIHEAVLDYTIVQHLEDKKTTVEQEKDKHGKVIREETVVLQLSENDRIDLMLAVLSGNLDQSVGDPQSILRGVIGLPPVAPLVPERRRSILPRKFSSTSKEASVQSPGSPLVRASSKAGEVSHTVVRLASIDSELADGRYEISSVADTSPRPITGVETLSTSEKAYIAELRLKSMLQSQYSFGSVVGAPVLFYIGSFIYTLVGLSDNLGDNDTAHALAFGMWWMGIVHVAIVSGCLLASNNPSTVTAVVAEQLVRQKPAERKQAADRKGSRTSLGMSPVYDSQFMPVQLWDRGRMKRLWITQTNAYSQPWFRELIEIRAGWFLIPLTAFFLVFIPCMLAFLVSYFTPEICLSCRSLTFLIYTCCQLVLIIATTLHTRYTDDKTALATIKASLRALDPLDRFIFAFALFILLCAAVMAFFLTLVGSLLHILGVYHNCLCSTPTLTWVSSLAEQSFNLPSDTADDRNASKYWFACGYAAIGFMAVVCYVGWWYQRYLRRRFVQRISKLGPRGGQLDEEMSRELVGGVDGADGVAVNGRLDTYEMTTVAGTVSEEAVETEVAPDDGAGKDAGTEVRVVAVPPL